MAVGSIEEFLEQIRKCRDWDTCNIPSPDTPLVEGLNSARILLVSQAPSEVAWDAHMMSGDYNYRGFIALFALDETGFCPENFVWINTGNCYPGKKDNSDFDAIPDEHCAHKFFPLLRPLLKDFDLIIISGRNAARRWAEEFECGWDPNDSLYKIVGRQFHTDGVNTDVIHHPSGASSWEEKYPDQARRCKELARQKIAKALSGITVESDKTEQQFSGEEAERQEDEMSMFSPVGETGILESNPAYILAMRLFELVMEDTEQLINDPRGQVIAKELVRSAGWVSANFEQGLGKGRGADFAYHLTRAKGSAEEAKGWYKRSEKFLSDKVIHKRIELLDEIVSMLANMGPFGRR